MASMSGHRGNLELSQFSDSTSYARLLTKLQLHSPTEIVLPDTLCQPGKSRLPDIIAQYMPDVHIVAIPRIHFNEKTGLENVQTFCLPDYKTVEYEVQDK